MTAGSPLVSVVMAVRNEAEWIGMTLRSVLDQQHRELEVIVVDDGSTDDTVAIIEAHAADPRLQWLSGPARGACAARNVGIARATGALIQMLDGDDLLAPDKISRQVARWQTEGDAFVYFGPFLRFADDPESGTCEPMPNWTDLSGHDWLVSCWLHGGMMAPHGWLTPSHLIRAAGPWDESLEQNQDGEFFSRVLLASGGVRFCPDALSHYRVGVKHSISRRRDRAARLSQFRATRKMAHRLLARDPDGERTRLACAIAYEELMFVNGVDHPDIAASARQQMLDCGGTDGSMPYRGARFRLMAAALGVPLAWRLQQLSSRFGRLLPGR